MWVGKNWMGVAKVNKDCSFMGCEEGAIIPGEIHIQIVYKRNTAYFYHPLHLTCVQGYLGDKYQEIATARRNAKKVRPKSRLDNYSPEDKLRRRRALQYIAWHKSRALDALAQQDGYRYENHVRYILQKVYEIEYEIVDSADASPKVASGKFYELKNTIPYWEEIRKRQLEAFMDELEPFDFAQPSRMVYWGRVLPEVIKE